MAKSQTQWGQPANYNSAPATRNDGDPSALEVDTTGNLKVNIAAGGSGVVDKSTFTPGTSTEQVVGGVYQSSVDTLASGETAAVAIDQNRNLLVSLASLIAGEDLVNNVLKVEERFSYANVTATTATTVKSGAGFIHAISINNPAALASATTATTIALYDNTAGSGTLIATFSLPVSASIASALPFSIPVDVSFSTGLTTVVTLGTSGSWTPNLTVSYR